MQEFTIFFTLRLPATASNRKQRASSFQHLSVNLTTHAEIPKISVGKKIKD